MTVACARWPELRERVAGRLDRRAGGPSLASEELAHLDDCPGCRRAALALDASLVLRPLAETAPERGDEIESMRLAVSALRRASRAPRRAIAPWGRAAAALLLLAGGLYVLPVPPAARDAAPPSSLAGLSDLTLGLPALGVVAPASFAYEPVVEDLNRPDARVYQLGGGDISVVMIVDETLDV